MYFLSKFIFFCSVFYLISPIVSQQFYDKSNCTSESLVQGSKYICDSNNSDCLTYIVYRAQQDFISFSSIASLFNLSQSDDILTINNLTGDDPMDLSLGREIIIPVDCHCVDAYFQATVTYNFSNTDSVNAVACGIFEGLVKSQSLIDENPGLRGSNPDGYLTNVHIRCACPDPNQQNNGVNYLVTYPIMEGDNTDLIASKFRIPEKMIWDANKLEAYTAIYPKTTLLVPTNEVPNINWDISSVPNNSPGPTGATPLRKVAPAVRDSGKLNYSQVFLGAGVCITVVSIMASCWVLIYNRRKYHSGNFQPLSARSSMSSNVSPDFLDGMSKLKHSLINFSWEEIRIATKDFNESLGISAGLYQGKVGGSYLIIEQMDSEEAAMNVIHILTKINHFNIVRLEGFCNRSQPYLVFEYAENGSLWDCLSNVELNRQLTWARRLRIAFDIVTALHYLHNSTTPAFVHHNINSRSVLITIDWRAKISGFSLAKPVTYGEQKESIKSNKSVTMARQEHLAAAHFTDRQVAVDVFAFGVVLLELVSGKEVITDGKILTDSVNFLLDKGLVGSSLFLEKLKEFMDPFLEGDYPLGNVICLALLAKSCMEENPDHRPTMNNVLVALAKIV